ncbi:MAG: hypothetical protein JWM25_1273, partial [Thermoleophilia bacterium]|nr:hypothetical protein [Thermoleophilia bacterium]
MASDQPLTAREPRLRVRIDAAPALRARAIWAAEALLARAGVAHWELVDSASDVDLAFPHDPAQWSFTWDRAPNADADPLAFTFWWLARVEERLAPEECFDEHGRFRYERSALARG